MENDRLPLQIHYVSNEKLRPLSIPVDLAFARQPGSQLESLVASMVYGLTIRRLIRSTMCCHVIKKGI